MIIACDFDGTLCVHKYPEIGEPNYNLIVTLIKKRRAGNKLILWTCRDGERLDEAVEWCRNSGLVFDAVNEDLPEIKRTFTFKSKKVYADIYIDDRNFCFKCDKL